MKYHISVPPRFHLYIYNVNVSEIIVLSSDKNWSSILIKKKNLEQQ